MRITIVAVGTRMPEWVEMGYRDYVERLPHQCRIELLEIPLARRTKSADPSRLIKIEGDAILRALPKHNRVIALDLKGQSRTTQQLADSLNNWLGLGQDVAMVIGGPDGLDARCLDRADETWSLSALTLPHALVRVVVVEQLYRAWSILNNLPYHRA